MRRERGWRNWIDTVHRLQQLHRSTAYHLMFFINAVPLACPDHDVFYDGGSADLNRFFVGTLGSGVPAKSVDDEFRHLRPSQMPGVAGHALGNANLVKVTVLFRYLRDELPPDLQLPTGGPPRAAPSARTNDVRHLR